MSVERISEIVLKEKQIVKGLVSFYSYLQGSEGQEKKFIESQIEISKNELRKTNAELLGEIELINLGVPLPKSDVSEELKKIPKVKNKPIALKKKISDISQIEKESLKRLRKKKQSQEIKKEAKPSFYVKIANSFFAERIKTIVKQRKLVSLEKDLIKSNLNYTPISYMSVLVLTIIITAIISILVVVFFIFFNLGIELPIITLAKESMGERFLRVFWLIFAAPLVIFLFMYFYPSLEKKSVEGKINQELPFATINMSAISGSRIEPVKVFSIIVSTKEYPNLEKEFNKILNKINVYGYDLVTALKDSASNCPSQKLAELLNGLATTITSGGDLFDFFEKRSQTLLFEYRLDKEKRTKTSETFMDIYISVVIAAPMILMLLLMMMRISGLGVSLSTGMITFLIVGGVSLINVFFLIFLQLKHTENT